MGIKGCFKFWLTSSGTFYYIGLSFFRPILSSAFDFTNCKRCWIKIDKILLNYLNLILGTMMMSGNGILTNGKGTRRDYGDFNLDELQVLFLTNIFCSTKLLEYFF